MCKHVFASEQDAKRYSSCYEWEDVLSALGPAAAAEAVPLHKGIFDMTFHLRN